MKKISLIFTVALVFALSLGVGIQSVQADSILFPYLSTQPGVYSFVTIANEGQNEFATLTGLHLSYGYKDVTAGFPAVNTCACNHHDVQIESTPSDMLTFEVGGKVVDGGNYFLFENAGLDTTVGNPTMMGGLTNHIGFLWVEPLGNATASEMDQRIEIWGWGDVLDTNANMNFSYSTNGLGSNDSTDPDLSASYDQGMNWYRFAWEPTTYVNTSWYILPISTRDDMTPAAGGGIRRSIRANNGAAFPGPGAFDRDEQFYSGEKLATVRCLGVINTSHLLQPGPIASTLNGGFLYAESWGTKTTALSDVCDPNEDYDGGATYSARIQSVTAAAGMGTRQTIGIEPMLNPTYDVTFDVGP
ncbi:MAG: hypothetical protein AB1306_03385 [Nitrospirota bacterium]